MGATVRRVVEFCSGWIAREAADYDEIARSIESIRTACVAAGRDPESVAFRASVIPTADWRAWDSTDKLFDLVIANSRKVAAAGVTHFSIPLNYFKVGLGDLELLLKALRAA
jgi:alkanesulfonate monooxygenase SsuD/methylene tetrahydromethanopterin reductase-like flavin-dependent oxidoreductase (luciferase family)